MKCIIAGSRGIDDYGIVKDAFNNCQFKDQITEIVSGGAKGVDALGERLGFEKNIKVVKFPADWKSLGKKAGIIRNAEMGDYADCLIAVWDGESRGTGHMIDYMKSLKKPVLIYVYKGE